MTELTLENYLMVQLAVWAGLFGCIAVLYNKIADLCTRVSVNETKEKIYHKEPGEKQ